MKTIEDKLDTINKKSNALIWILCAILAFVFWLIVLLMQSPYTY